MVLHADGPRRSHPGGHDGPPAAAHPPPPRDRSVAGGLRHGRDDHGHRERARPPRVVLGAVGLAPGPRPAAVLRADLRRSRRRGRDVGVAVRRAPRVAALHRDGGSAGRRHAVLLRRRSGQRAAPRAPRAAPPGRHRGRRLRTARLARPGAARPGGHLPRRPDRPRPRQPHDDHGGRPTAVAARRLAGPVRARDRRDARPHAGQRRGRARLRARPRRRPGVHHEPEGPRRRRHDRRPALAVRRPAGPVRAAAAGRDRRAGAGEAPP